MLFTRKKRVPKNVTMTLVSLEGATYRTLQQDHESEDQFLERSRAEAKAYFDTL